MLLDHDFVFSFYGDDFTGSTDVMENLTINGIRTALFLAPVTLEEVKKFRLKHSLDGTGAKDLQAFGIAGISRSLRIAQMDAELPPIFEAISKIPADFFQYKVCSTFDSSPDIGSIGHASDLAFRYFPCDWIPVLIGAPFINRFCVFGNLFARVDDVTYRLDRHPTMSKHPVTPMTESDLRRHLALQTKRPARLLDLFALEADDAQQQAAFERLNTRQGEFILFDTYNDEHLLRVGKLVVKNKSSKTQLIVSSSGANVAVARYLQAVGKIAKPPAPTPPQKETTILALSGSCSPQTGKQIEHVLSIGFEDMRIDTVKLIDPRHRDQEQTRLVEQATRALSSGRSVMLYSAKGPDDPAIMATKQRLEELELEHASASQTLASVKGRILRRILDIVGKKRVVVCGGDTSGHVARELGIYALETRMPIAPGAPLCTAHSKQPEFDGLEITLKGGQNGRQRYIESIMHGYNIDS
ncbi:MAG: four-carbon acid sugar kinase family protein [Phycisphaerales bacterium]|nr:four-carbon acid sugar kinase family protein [Phycisphaerales bacterium]